MNIKKGLVMALSDPSADPRPRRVIVLLNSMEFDVDVLSYSAKENIPICNHYLISKGNSVFSKVIRRFKKTFLSKVSLLFFSHYHKDLLNDRVIGVASYRNDDRLSDYNLIVVEDIQLLPLAFQLKNNARILFDAREYYPRQNEHSLLFRIFIQSDMVRLCQHYLPLCDALITVSDGLSGEYEKKF